MIILINGWKSLDIIKTITYVILVLVPAFIIVKTLLKIIIKIDIMITDVIKVLICLLVMMLPIVCNTSEVLINNYKKEKETVTDNYVFSLLTKIEYSSIKELKTMYIGDSRTVGMYNALYGGSDRQIYISNDSELWYAKVAIGYNWFVNDAMSKMEYYLYNDDYNVIILMGANDLYNANLALSYLDNIEKMASEHPNSNYFIVSVNPINDELVSSHGYTVRNNDVIAFNKNFEKEIKDLNLANIYYCDTYSKVINDYHSSDGLHYDKKTYQKIYELINKCL